MTQVELAAFQVSRRSLPWMLAAVVAALLPHVAHQPVWLTAVCAVCVGWRYAVHRGRVAYPPARWQALFALLLIGGVFAQYRTLAGHEAGTAMLVAMFSLKLLEMYKERDAYVVILIGYFVASTIFLFFFSLWMAVYVVGVALLFTATLVSINASLDAPRGEPIRRAAVLMLQSVPIAVLLFVVMPRIGPLWSIGLKPGDAMTGISDSMSPGSVGKLAQSDALAFRVDFEGRVPPAGRLYWRGLTFGQFDGTTWSPGPDPARDPALVWYPGTRMPAARAQLDEVLASAPPERRLQYTVVLEPTQRPWLFALTLPVSEQRGVGMVFDQSLRLREPAKTLTRYRVTTYADVPRDLGAPSGWLDQYRQLPPDSNPKSRQWALQQRAEVASDEAFAERVVALFRDEDFAYTLEPPPLGADPVDAFLFGTRRGFCEHYASAFTLLMRAAGIPARVVAGYQGGEVNPVGSTVQVRQYDAHAWAEIWLPGRGWVEFDPTAVVAPERIADGSRVTRGERDALFGAPLGEGTLGDSLRAIGDVVDYLNHGWNNWVLGFDDQAQKGFLTRWLGSMSPYRIGMLVLGSGAVLVALLSLWMFRENLFSRVDPVLREYHRFCAAWAKRGHARRTGEGPWDYLARLESAEPQRAQALRRFIVLYSQLAYGGRRLDGDTLARLRNARGAAT